MKAAVDTTNILGLGAVKDAYKLLSDGIVQLARVLSAVEGNKVKDWSREHELERYFGSSVKGEARIDWDNEKARQDFLGSIVADADSIYEVARQAQDGESEECVVRKRIVEAAQLLGRLLLQDVERKDDSVTLKQGVSRDCIISVHYPDMRHGRKSSSKRFDGDRQQ
jgi:hypothetical protein